MKLGRLYFGLIDGALEFGKETFSCKCKCLNLGFFYVIKIDKTCVCGGCKQYECVCYCEWCGYKFSKCECGDDSA